MKNRKFLHGPGIVQLLQGRGLWLQEHLSPILTKVAELASQNGDPLAVRRYAVGLVAALPEAPDRSGDSEAWCGAVEAMYHYADSRPAALVIESDPVQRKFAATALVRAGMTVNAVDHTDGALLCDSVRYNFILMDYAWPTGRGADLAEEIRAGQGPNTDTYILGSSCNLAQRECLAAGMDSFVQKPIDLPALKRVALRAASGPLTVSSVP